MNMTPAELGILAAKRDTQEQKFMAGLLDEFKAFVLESMAEGHHDNYADHHDFLKDSLKTWSEYVQELTSVEG